jgi:A/G-specific adenine glycosylase
MIDRPALARWYRSRRDAYPWRRDPTSYGVLVSEVMLQQTQAARVVPAFDRFLREFPTLRALAEAPRSAVLRAWSGLGYNRRAVRLHQAAREIVSRHGGRVPADPHELERLPGVGPYTASAVAALAHGVPVAAVDVNVARVVARAVLGSEPQAQMRRAVAEAADGALDRRRPGLWNQAVMDLGREVCRPRPRCQACPLRPACAYAAREVVDGEGGPAPAPRRGVPGRYEGSSRQLRGGIVRAAVVRGEVTLAVLAAESGRSVDQVAATARILETEGLVALDRLARDRSPEGLVRAPDHA